MSAIVILIFGSLLVSIGFLIAFIWAVKSGQFDDNYTPSIRMLLDDKIDNTSSKKEKTKEGEE